jgi:hypothetical protein
MEHQGAGNGVAAARQSAAIGNSDSGGLPTRRYEAGKRARNEDGSVSGDTSDSTAVKRRPPSAGPTDGGSTPRAGKDATARCKYPEGITSFSPALPDNGRATPGERPNKFLNPELG